MIAFLLLLMTAHAAMLEPVAEDLIFLDGFESGGLSEWSSCCGCGGLGCPPDPPLEVEHSSAGRLSADSHPATGPDTPPAPPTASAGRHRGR